MSNLSDFIGVSASSDFEVYAYFKGMADAKFFGESEIWTVPKTGNYAIICQGGGASGSGTYGTNTYPLVAGGSSGFFGITEVGLTENEEVIVTVGAGGVGSNDSVGHGGGATSFGSYLTANGGIVNSALNTVGDGSDNCGYQNGLPANGGSNYGFNKYDSESNPIYKVTTNSKAGCGGNSLFGKAGAARTSTSNGAGFSGGIGAGGGGNTISVSSGYPYVRSGGNGGNGLCIAIFLGD